MRATHGLRARSLTLARALQPVKTRWVPLRNIARSARRVQRQWRNEQQCRDVGGSGYRHSGLFAGYGGLQRWAAEGLSFRGSHEQLHRYPLAEKLPAA